jgi:adenylyltransferase/sulfurtransferase
MIRSCCATAGRFCCAHRHRRPVALKDSRALIVGLGGLGAPVALYLAAAGVGELHLADFDTVDLTNLQRQIIHDTDSVGMSKVDSAIQRLAPSTPRFNWSPTAPRWTKIPWPLRWRRWTGARLFRQFLHPRSGQRRLRGRRKPLVSGAAIRLEGQLSVFDPRRRKARATTAYTGTAANRTDLQRGRVVGPLVGLVGSLQALEALKLLAGFGEPLVGRCC